jgi:hypothetical protein
MAGKKEFKETVLKEFDPKAVQVYTEAIAAIEEIEKGVA